MKTKEIASILMALAVFLTLPCIAHVLAGVPDKTDECLSQIDWKKSAFQTADYSGVVLVQAASFDSFAKCAYAGVDFASGLALPSSSNDSFKEKLREMSDLMAKYPELDDDIREAADVTRRVPMDLLIGTGTETHPTMIFRASYIADPSALLPVDEIRHRGLTYQRSPAHPGFCDDLKGDVERYKWCTGENHPKASDPRMQACKNQYCD